MKFACITLSYNQSHYLPEAIASILEQKEEIDYVVYDPGSTDISRDLILEYKSPRVRHFFVNGDLGPADGLNQALKQVHGDIFYYLNADDRVLPGAFAYVTKYFQKHPECDVLHGSILLIDELGEIIKYLPAMKFSLRGYAMRYSYVYQQATFIRKDAMTNDPFNVSNRVSWDGELIVDLARAGKKIHQTQTILGEFRIHSESITGSGRLKQLAKTDHSRITLKILDRELSTLEKIMALIIRKSLALTRRLVPRIENL